MVKPEWMQAILAKAEARRALAAKLARNTDAVVLRGEGQRWVLATGDSGRAGGYRLTFFDGEEPTGHIGTNTMEEAVDEGLKMGMKPGREPRFRSKSNTLSRTLKASRTAGVGRPSPISNARISPSLRR